ncbi:MAG: MBL fold metallo-hydrolase [Verrucomicrobiae bacterium]|nr:MBL fold metallo-hydrolase [Verrucomicrobiae bacterium]
MKITFCGAARTTTGSKHLLTINGKKILLECGLFQGKRQESFEKNQHLPFDPASIDIVILSHAHIDHSGNLPLLCKQGFNGNIISTFATRDLCQLMLADSAKVQAADVAYLNKKRLKNNLTPLAPYYTIEEVEKCLEQFVTINYRRPFQICEGVTLTFYDAGHILGSAQVCLDIVENGKKKRLLFSGDIGRGNNDLLRDPEAVTDVDYLIMESTYGAREHETATIATHQLCEIINRNLERRGKILIPAFAVERTQQLIYIFHQILTQNCIPPLPIYIDSPLAVNTTEVFRLHPECFNEEAYNILFEKRDPFGSEHITYIRQVAQSMELNHKPEPCIIISASGMCEAGRILHHLRNHIEDPSTTILFVGYCAENTLGAKIRAGEKRVNILGESFQVNAHIEALDSFSGHADRSELLDYVEKIQGAKEKIWLVHGEPEQSEPFSCELAQRYPQSQITVADYLQEVDL